MINEEKTEDLRNRRHRNMMAAVLLTAAIVVLILGTMAWFSSRQSAATVTVMGDPSDLSLIGKDAGELRLDMSPADPDAEKNADGTVTIKRIFGVKSKYDHWLEVVHTTNTDEFDFKIYKATANADGTYNVDTSPIDGTYLNEVTGTDNTKTAISAAGDYYYNNNFVDEDTVQQNAVPLYWKNAKLLKKDTSNETYYYLEVTWKETDKETDIFYIFASDSETTE